MRRGFWVGWGVLALLVLLGVLLPRGALAQGAGEGLSGAQIEALVMVQGRLETVADLEERGVLSAEVAGAQRAFYLGEAEAIVGRPVDSSELIALLVAVTRAGQEAQPGTLERVTGFLTFVNVIWVTSSILLVVAVGWLLQLYLLPLLRLIPLVVYELLIYVGCLGFLVAGRFFAAGVDDFVALPGCLGLIGALVASHILHKERLGRWYKETGINPLSANALLLCLVWAGIAVWYESTLIGFLAVMALEVFLGFSVVVQPLCYFIGFQNKEVIPRAMGASLALLLVYVPARISGWSLAGWEIFAPGALFLGSFVYFIGLLIVSSRFYRPKGGSYYGRMQLLTIVSGVLALLVGSVWQIGQLQGIGGTFFFLYLLEKYFEVPWRKRHLAWATLGLAVLLYLSALVIRQYPAYFLLLGRL